MNAYECPRCRANLLGSRLQSDTEAESEIRCGGASNRYHTAECGKHPQIPERLKPKAHATSVLQDMPVARVSGIDEAARKLASGEEKAVEFSMPDVKPGPRNALEELEHLFRARVARRCGIILGGTTRTPAGVTLQVDKVAYDVAGEMHKEGLTAITRFARHSLKRYEVQIVPPANAATAKAEEAFNLISSTLEEAYGTNTLDARVVVLAAAQHVCKSLGDPAAENVLRELRRLYLESRENLAAERASDFERENRQRGGYLP